MKPSLQATFQVVHANNAHAHVFPNLANLAQRRSYASNKDIDQYLRKHSKPVAGERQEDQDQSESDNGGSQLQKDYSRPINAKLVPTAELPHQIYEANHAAASHTAQSQRRGTLLTDGIRHQHVQLSDTEESTSSQKQFKKRKSRQFEPDGIYDKPKGSGHSKKKRKELSQVEMRQTIYDSKNNAVFPSSSAYGSKASSNGSKHRVAKRSKIAKGMPYAEPVMGSRSNNHRQTTKRSAQLNMTMVSVRAQKNQPQPDSNDNSRIISSAYSTGKKGQSHTPKSSVCNAQNVYFNDEKFMNRDQDMVLLTQQHFNSRSSQRKNNFIEIRNPSGPQWTNSEGSGNHVILVTSRQASQTTKAKVLKTIAETSQREALMSHEECERSSESREMLHETLPEAQAKYSPIQISRSKLIFEGNPQESRRSGEHFEEVRVVKNRTELIMTSALLSASMQEEVRRSMKNEKTSLPQIKQSLAKKEPAQDELKKSLSSRSLTKSKQEAPLSSILPEIQSHQKLGDISADLAELQKAEMATQSQSKRPKEPIRRTQTINEATKSKQIKAKAEISSQPMSRKTSINQRAAKSLERKAVDGQESKSPIVVAHRQPQTLPNMKRTSVDLPNSPREQFIIAEEGLAEESSVDGYANTKTLDLKDKPLTAVTPKRHNNPPATGYGAQLNGSPRPQTTPTSAAIRGQRSADSSRSQIRSREHSIHNTNTVVKTQLILNDRSPRRQTQPIFTPQQVPRIINSNKYQDSTIYCQATFAEPFYRRAMLKLGWQLVPVQTIQLKPKFHIKFDVDDLQGTGAEIKSTQFYNHFPGNRECVTKAGLCRNLWVSNDFESETRATRFFPRCYDLSDLKQTNEFVADFHETAIISILKLLADNIERSNLAIVPLVEQLRRSVEFDHPRVFKQQLKRKCWDLDRKNYPEGGLIGSDELRMTYSFCKGLYHKIKLREQKKRRGRKPHKGYELDLPKLIRFQTKLVEEGVPPLLIDTYDQVKILKLCQDLTGQIDQSKSIDGVHNIWIVKPSYNSRGVGIYCTRQLSQIITENKKTQQKVVQKYIERPFYVTENRKFDLRQWVLVNSWEPLDVCVFSSAYLKICSSPFDLTKLDDVNRHLSNFTINKRTAEAEEIVMSSQQFEEFMRAHSREDIPKDFSWREHMLPKIKDLVWRTLKSVQATQEQRNNCFEVFGFDIVLDNDLSPWLIEVNLSPACSERTPWLTQMLDESSLDLLSHVQQKILIANPNDSWTPELQKARRVAYQEQAELRLSENLNSEHFYESNKHLDRWIRLQESINEIRLFNRLQTTNEQKCELAITGQKADLKFERRLLKNYDLHQGVQLIQRFWRGYRGRRQFRYVLETKHALVIQRHARMWLAKRLARFIRKTNGATLVQQHLRRVLAQILLARMRKQRTLEQKTAIVTKLQSHYRRRQAVLAVQEIRKQKAARCVQKVIKGYIARQIALKLRTRWVKATLIQRFYRKRYQQRMKASKCVQKHIRGFLISRKVSKLSDVNKGALRLLAVLKKHQKAQGIAKIRVNSKAIFIQAHLRRVVQRNRCLKQLKMKAHAQFVTMTRTYLFKLIRGLAAQYRQSMEDKATILQRRLRSVIARKRASLLRRELAENNAASLVQRYLRGYLAVQEASNMRLQIGAAIMIQALWRGYLGRKRFQKILDRQYKQVQRELAREKRAAEKQAKEDYDPSNDNLLQIFGIMKKQSKQKLPRVQSKELKKKTDSKKKLNTKDSARANKLQIGKNQPAQQIEEAAQGLNRRRRLKKSKIREKLFKLQADVTRRSTVMQKAEDQLSSDQFMSFDSRVERDDQTSQLSARDTSVITGQQDLKFLPQPISRLSIESVPIHDLTETAKTQANAAQKLLSLGHKLHGQQSQRASSKDVPEHVKIMKKSIETSMDLVGRGSSVAKTVVIRKDPSRDKIPVWAANAIKACESPKLIEKPSIQGNNGHQVLEKVFKNGAVKYKVFNMKQRPAIENTTQLDSEQTQKLQTEVSRYILDQNRPANQAKATRNTVMKERNASQMVKEKSQLQKTKTFAQNLLEMLEHQTKNSIEVKKAQSQEKRPLQLPPQKNLPAKSPKLINHDNDLQPSRVNVLINAYEPKKHFAPVKLSPHTQEAVAKLNGGGVFGPIKKPKQLPPVEGAPQILAINDTGKKQLEPIDHSALTILQRRATDERMELAIASRGSLQELKGYETREGDFKSQHSSKGLTSFDSHKSEFATNYDAFKSKRFSKGGQLIKSSEQIISDMQRQQRQRQEAVVQAHKQHMETKQMIFEPLQSSQSTRAQAVMRTKISSASQVTSGSGTFAV